MLRSLTARTVLVLGLLAVFVGALFGLLLRNVAAQERAAEAARASEARVEASIREQKLLVDVETAVRGYLITTDRRYLELFDAARRDLPAQQERLRRLETNPADGAALAHVHKLSSEYVAGYAAPIASARPPRAHARRAALTAEGKRRMDLLRSLIDRYMANEVAQSRVAADDAAASSDATVLLAAGGLGSSVLLVLLVAVYQLRSVLAPVRRVGAAARRVATGDLTVRVGDKGSGEVGELAESFNLMATSLE